MKRGGCECRGDDIHAAGVQVRMAALAAFSTPSWASCRAKPGVGVFNDPVEQHFLQRAGFLLTITDNIDNMSPYSRRVETGSTFVVKTEVYINLSLQVQNDCPILMNKTTQKLSLTSRVELVVRDEFKHYAP